MYEARISYRKNNWSYIRLVKILIYMILNQTSIYRLRQKNLILPVWIMIRRIRPSKHISLPIIEKIHHALCYQIYETVTDNLERI
jgi:hypothetical protein